MCVRNTQNTERASWECWGTKIPFNCCIIQYFFLLLAPFFESFLNKQNQDDILLRHDRMCFMCDRTASSIRSLHSYLPKRMCVCFFSGVLLLHLSSDFYFSLSFLKNSFNEWEKKKKTKTKKKLTDNSIFRSQNKGCAVNEPKTPSSALLILCASSYKIMYFFYSDLCMYIYFREFPARYVAALMRSGSCWFMIIKEDKGWYLKRVSCLSDADHHRQPCQNSGEHTKWLTHWIYLE